MSDIFISYARKDLNKVSPIAKALEAQGWDVWWDSKIRSGSQIDSEIEKALAETRSVLVVWSKASSDSKWVRAEATSGFNEKIFFSIAIERDVPVPIQFFNTLTVPLIDWDGEKPSDAFDKIISDLEATLGSPEASKTPADKEDVVTKKRSKVNVKLLSFLVDRNHQNKQIFSGVDALQDGVSIPPLIGLIHGKDRQCPDIYTKCIEKYYWPKHHEHHAMDPDKANLKRIRFIWPETYDDFEDFKKHILNYLCDRFPIPEENESRDKTISHISHELYKRYNGPILIETVVITSDWQKKGEEIVNHFLQFWEQWPVRKYGNPLMACLIIMYTEHGKKKGLLKRLKRMFSRKNRGTKSSQTTNDEIRRTLENIDRNKFENLKLVVLKELEGIEYKHVMDWAELPEVKRLCHEEYLSPFVRSLFEETEENGRIAMEIVAKKLEYKLKEFNPD